MIWALALEFQLVSPASKRSERPVGLTISVESPWPAEKKTIGITESEFNEEMHNFGPLQSGEILVYTFIFTNTGDIDLIIDNVETDCGCIHAKFSKDPIKPGKTGFIEVEFDSSGLFGKQFKTIEVHANTKKPKQLAIFAEVKNEQLEIKY